VGTSLCTRRPSCPSLPPVTARSAAQCCLDMLTSSSPTISAPSSPSAAFHAPSRAYHASRRTSASSSAHSPRFTVGASSRRYDVTPASRPIPIPSPSPAFAHPSPQGRKRAYVDAGTQYTPPGLPPTFHPPVQSAASSNDTAAVAPLVALPAASTQRGESSAAPVVTEPSEPDVRVDPQLVAPAQNAQPQNRRLPNESSQTAVGQERVPPEASAVLQVPPSPAKRARPQNPSLKIMPLLYETCDAQDLGVLISDMLMELVRINDEQPLRDGTLTRFHSRYDYD
jgi:hypothetical protein